MDTKREKEIRETIHAINNLMAVNLLSAEILLREETSLTQEQKKCLHDILKNEKKCALLLKNLRQTLLD